jgi:signal-transduction protein with cAMP-binding, CBS, and nucleotidyltransferase domain
MALVDCIRTDVVTASPEERVSDIARMMDEQNVGSVVIERDGCPVGIVTDRDLALRVCARNVDPESTSVRDVMTCDPFVVDRNDTLWNVMASAREQGVRRFPVVDDDQRLVGIVTMDDVVRILASEMSCVTDIIQSSSPSAR